MQRKGRKGKLKNKVCRYYFVASVVGYYVEFVSVVIKGGGCRCDRQVV